MLYSLVSGQAWLVGMFYRYIGLRHQSSVSNDPEELFNMILENENDPDGMYSEESDLDRELQNSDCNVRNLTYFMK